MNTEIQKKIDNLTPKNQKYFYDIIKDIIDNEEYSQRFKDKSIQEIYEEVYNNTFDERGKPKSSTLDSIIKNDHNPSKKSSSK